MPGSKNDHTFRFLSDPKRVSSDGTLTAMASQGLSQLKSEAGLRFQIDREQIDCLSQERSGHPGTTQVVTCCNDQAHKVEQSPFGTLPLASPTCSSVYSSRDLGTSPPTSLSYQSATSENQSQYEQPYSTLELESACIQVAQSSQIVDAVDNSRASSGMGNYARDVLPLDVKYDRLFRSLCICDPKISGQPVQSASTEFSASGPRHLRVGKCCFLNLSVDDNAEKAGCSLYARRDKNTLRWVLDYVIPIVHRKNRVRYYLIAAQLDITEVVRDLALQFLENTSRMKAKSTASDDSIDWIGLAKEFAMEESSGKSSSKSEKSAKKPLIMPENVVEFSETLLDLRHLHQYAFVLSVSSFSHAWVISWVSQALLEKGQEDIEIGLKNSETSVLEVLGMWMIGANAANEQVVNRDVITRDTWFERPSQRPEPLTMKVRWGVKGVEKWLYAIPTFRADEHICHRWVCFLTDKDVGCVWG